MPKKQIEDDEDIIEIEEFPEQKPEKSVKKQNTDKKAKIKKVTKKKQPPPPESEEDEDEEEDEEEEEDEKPTRKSKTKITSKKAISENRL